jgi:hypothetical protein
MQDNLKLGHYGGIHQLDAYSSISYTAKQLDSFARGLGKKIATRRS